MKRTEKLAALLAVLLLLTLLPGAAMAEPEFTVRRELLPMDGGAAAISDAPVITGLGLMQTSETLYAGEPAKIIVDAVGGVPPYAYEYWLSQMDAASGEFIPIEGTAVTTTENEYLFTVPDVDAFYFHLTLTDAAGEQVSTIAQCPAPSRTLASKVKSIVAECAPEGASDYQKAFNLYNWLCVNASYDYTYTWYTAEGVLLHGTGVCDSFASAYIMLLNEAGIDCKKVLGSDLRGESHAWVLVKLGGEWYHMDPTWDEASSHRFYFGLSTALIARDHVIAGMDAGMGTVGGSAPGTSATRYNYEMNRADGVFASTEELGALLNSLPADKTEFSLYYTGVESANEIIQWCNTHMGEYGILSVSLEGSSDAVFLFTGTRGETGTEPQPEAGFAITEDGVLVSGFGLTGDVSIPGDLGLTSIADGAFTGCSQMTSLEIPEGIAAIGKNIFEGCNALTEVHLPGSVVSIDGDILSGLPAVVHCPNGSYAMHWAMKHGHDYALPAGSRILAMPAETGEIQAEAFSGNASIRCVVVNSGLHTIGSRAFAGCTGLVSINLPASVTSIGEGTFAGCSGLTVYCEAGSYAQTWCQANGVSCVIL